MTLRFNYLLISLPVTIVLAASGCSRNLAHTDSGDASLIAGDRPPSVVTRQLPPGKNGQRRDSPYQSAQSSQSGSALNQAGNKGEAPNYRQPVTDPELILPPVVQLQSPAPPAEIPIQVAEKATPAPGQSDGEQRKEEALVLALRSLLENRPDEAIELLKRYDNLNQEMMLSLLALAARLTKGGLEKADPKEVSNVLVQLESLGVALRPLAALTIEKMCLCSEISRFGTYHQLPEGQGFQAGNDGQPGEPLQLYVELRNFTSQPNNSYYETLLASHLEIRDLRGFVVWRQDFPTDRPDRSHTLRNDYFISFRFPVPSRLLPGRYTLWVEVRDKTGQTTQEIPARRIARRSLDFEVVAPGSSRPQPSQGRAGIGN